jgi:YidC/Oxa1 family membrane protein insertase
MDRKSIIIIVVCLLVLVAWFPLVVNKLLYPPQPLPPGSTNLVTSASSTTGTVSAATTSTSSAPSAPAPLVEKAEPPSLTAITTPQQPEKETLVEITNSYANYVFSSQGGGLKEVQLLAYPEQVDRKSKHAAIRRVATLNNLSPATAFSISGGLESDGIYTIRAIPNGVRAEKALTNGLFLVKEYQLSTNYLLDAVVRIENRSKTPISLPAQDWIVGTASPMGPDDNGQAVSALWYNGHKTQETGAGYFSSSTMGCVPRTPPTEYRGGESNVVWVAVKNQFFALVAMPEGPAQSVVVQKLNLPRFPATASSSRSTQPPVGYITAMTYPAGVVAPGQSLERKAHIFAGPKEYQTIARIATRFGNNLDLIMGYSGFFGFFAKALLIAMNWIHDILRFSYGWAIVAITVVIKLLFWPLTQASTRSMKRLQALQPQMKAIQEKYKDDPAKMNRKTMEFMKEHKVSPLGGCLPMLLQIPVFFGFYSMIQSAIELRGASWLWVADLSKPDTLFIIPGTTFPFNLLPLLMGVTMLWQARLTPPSPGMDPTQAKIMRYMPLMFMVFLYNFSAGLTLYWTVQNILTIVQTKLTKTTEPAAGAAPALTPHVKKKK